MHLHRPGLMASSLAALAACVVLAACTQDAGSSAAKPKKKTKKTHLVELATVARDTLSLSRIYTGSLRARRVVRVHVQEEGRITSLPYFEGDAVAKGDELLSLDPTLLRTEVDKAVAVRREALANLKRLDRLSSSHMVAEEEVLRARTTVDVAKAEEVLLRTRLGYTTVRAPFAGVVTERLSEPGDIMERHDHVLTLADPSSLVADLKVSELLIPHLSEGHPAQVRIDALGDQQFSGYVLRIHPNLDPVTRQGRVEVALDPPPAAARGGQFARVTFQVSALDRQTIPFSALRRDSNGEYVYRLLADLKVERVVVRGGRRLAETVEILEGLDDGDRVVVKGFLGLTPGTKVEPVNGETPGSSPGASAGSATGSGTGSGTGSRQ